nr:YjgN family protein [uncultured Caldimonas sp.]
MNTNVASAHLPVPDGGAVVVDSGGMSGMVSSIGSEAPSNSVFSRLLHPAHAHHIPLEFTGSGSEYFRIWIVNLLLTLVTLGIYYPWAKVRKLRYFYGNTVVAGHALDFHGQPRKMLRGTFFAGVLIAAYGHAGEFSPVAGFVAALALSLLWPLLLRAALQFRMGHTSWRGLRFSFVGSTADAYKALAVPLLIFLLLPSAIGLLADGEAGQTDLEVAEASVYAILAVLGVGMLALPYFHWRQKKYQHDHYRLAQLQTELRLGIRPVYGIYLRTFLMALAVPVTLGIAVAATLGGVFSGQEWSSAVLIILAVFAWALFLFGGLYIYIVVAPYFTVRLQNLLWTKTGNRYLRFRSELMLSEYIILQLKNYLLSMITLGLYWPWAAIANRRMRLQAVTLVSRIDLDELYTALKPRMGDAAADMGDDLLGFDLGM